MINGLERYKKKWNITTENAIKPGLAAITAALEEIGNPHKQGRFVHIAGTNGKGSTAALLSAVLRAHGKTVGSFYSPGIIDVHDQIQMNGEPVTRQALDHVMCELSKVTTALTDFELLTAAAFLQFRNAAPDVSIIEAGMGGRFDSTNVIDPQVAIIPSIAKEHTNFLGTELKDIAYHKAGIIKKWKPVIAGPLENEALQVVKEEARQQHAELIIPNSPYEGELKLKGAHQKWNASLAYHAAMEVLGAEFNEAAAHQALAQAEIAYRFETAAPGLIFDGAHNEASINALVETIQADFPDEQVRIVLGMLRDKDYEKVLRKLETISDNFVFIDFSNERALPAEKLFRLSNSKIKTIKNLYDILPVTVDEEVTIVTGSLYLLSDMRKPGIPFLSEYLNVSD